MVFDKDQFEVWSKTGADKGSKVANERVRNIINNSDFSRKNDLEIFLQGSYANTTHVRANSDVDVVVKLKNIWKRDLNKLSPLEVIKYNSWASDSVYSCIDLKNDLIRIFVKELGESNVVSRNKCIKINLGKQYLEVDLIPCIEYRDYISFDSEHNQEFVDGISITTDSGKVVYNFPKQHLKNGFEKHQSTRQIYKKVVRIVKNIRDRLVDEDLLDTKAAPSYFVECLMFNVPDAKFDTNLQKSTLDSILWLVEEAPLERLKCKNGLTNLFGQDDTQWDIEDCNLFLSTVYKFLMDEDNA